MSKKQVNKTLTEMLNGDNGYMLQAIALRVINLYSTNEVAKSKLIKPIKHRTNETSIDEFANYKSGLCDEFKKIAETDEQEQERLFNEALPVANASVLLARDLVRTEPASAFWLRDIQTPEQKIIDRINYIFDNPNSENENRKAVIKSLSNIEGVSDNLAEANAKTDAEKNELIKNSLTEFASLNNAEEVMSLSTQELLEIVKEYEPNTDKDIIESINKRVIGIIQSYTKGKIRNIDNELVVYAQSL